MHEINDTAPARPVVRLMTSADIARAISVTAEAFTFDASVPETRARWERRFAHTLHTDPGGSFVVERDGTIVGVTVALVREHLWILSLLVVSPSGRYGGEGRALLDAALAYGADHTGAGLIPASSDPRALRLYASSGFILEPTFEASGELDPQLIPPPDAAVRTVAGSELETLEPISRAVRGAAHTPDLAGAHMPGGTVLALEGRGFAVVESSRGSVSALAALDEHAATTLLWAALDRLRDQPRAQIMCITGAQQWALAVLLDARLPFRPRGAFARRGNVGPLYPYIPSPPFG